jgi:hypothetical protein
VIANPLTAPRTPILYAVEVETFDLTTVKTNTKSDERRHGYVASDD